MTDSTKVNRGPAALISVTDKACLVGLAKELHNTWGYEIISTGGTAELLRETVDVTEVSDLTGFPEMMDGRLKTLHPVVHGGLLGRRDVPADVALMNEHGMPDIRVVVVNLYDFAAAVAAKLPAAECIEKIDIGGPAMIRSAAKGGAFVLTAPNQYDPFLAGMRQYDGSPPEALRSRLFTAAFAHTAAYDAAITAWSTRQQPLDDTALSAWVVQADQ